MKVPPYLRKQVKSWGEESGVVYLMRCAVTGEHKFGATADPAPRFNALRYHSKKRGMDMRLVWTIQTNSIGRLEKAIRKRWQKYRIDERLEWVNLPQHEIDSFRSASVINWKAKGLRPISNNLKLVLDRFKPGWPLIKADNSRAAKNAIEDALREDEQRWRKKNEEEWEKQKKSRRPKAGAK